MDQQNIFIAGFRIGGIMAPVVAQGEPIKGIVVYGTASRNFIEYQLQNLRRQGELSGMPYDALNERLKLDGSALHRADDARLGEGTAELVGHRHADALHLCELQRERLERREPVPDRDDGEG